MTDTGLSLFHEGYRIGGAARPGRQLASMGAAAPRPSAALYRITPRFATGGSRCRRAGILARRISRPQDRCGRQVSPPTSPPPGEMACIAARRRRPERASPAPPQAEEPSPARSLATSPEGGEILTPDSPAMTNPVRTGASRRPACVSGGSPRNKRRNNSKTASIPAEQCKTVVDSPRFARRQLLIQGELCGWSPPEPSARPVVRTAAALGRHGGTFLRRDIPPHLPPRRADFRPPRPSRRAPPPPNAVEVKEPAAIGRAARRRI
jgi:hypothetical protein